MYYILTKIQDEKIVQIRNPPVKEGLENKTIIN